MRPLFVLALAANCFAQAPLVKGVGNFIHNVSNLDASVRFYRDQLGLDMPRPPGDFQESEGVLKLYGAAGGRYRVATAQVPGIAMRVELAEFQGVDRKPVRRRLGDAGVSILMLSVADLQPVMDRFAASNVPLAVKMTQTCDGRGIAVEDPDGFLVVVTEPKAAAANSKSFTGLKFGYIVFNDDVLNGPFKALNLTGSTSAQSCPPIAEALLGAKTATIVKLADGFEISLFQSTTNKKDSGTTRPQDPSAAVLRLSVTDAEKAVQLLTQAGTPVASAGGVLQTLIPGGTKAAILKAPDGLFIQVVQ